MADSQRQDGRGHVYVMTNRAMPGLVKVGFTTKTPEERARGLSAPTGVPAPYRVVWATTRIRDFKEVERAAHERLRGHRDGGEFFRVTERQAIRAVKVPARAARRRRFATTLRRLVVAIALGYAVWRLWDGGFRFGFQ